MRKLFFAILFFFQFSCFGEELVEDVVQPQIIRDLCKKCQIIEAKISKLETELANLKEKEKMSVPVVRNVYEMLSRCFTVLFDMQRFSNMLVLIPNQNKNDFVRCSIVIKGFSSYFKAINSKLGQSGNAIARLKQRKENALKDYEQSSKDYVVISEELRKTSEQITSKREKNVTQEDVVCHIAAKCGSIEELDAELEAENMVGILKNTKISTKLALVYPVSGKIVAEFGDRGTDGEMIFYLGFETSKGAVVTSPVKGLIVFAGNFLNHKNMVVLSNGDYRIFVYGIKTLFASIGDLVEVGDFLGWMDNSTENHQILKMELKRSGEPLDPRHWLLQMIDNGDKK
ncbi:MAG: hypothetical protein E7015_03205 [Alphaproteobacteria bacterium]|nr:hypothetical protein [Alphaproteobacteria bacterium]